MELSHRLQTVCDMVTKGNRVVDVGCDHGFVSIYLVQNKISPSIIAMDINQGPLKRAKKHVEDCGLQGLIQTRLSDGLQALLIGEADTLICAGMGGRLMIDILSKRLEIVQNLDEIILQPQSNLQGLRKYLRKNGLIIVNEDMIVEDEKFYTFLRIVPEKKHKKQSFMPYQKPSTEIPQILEDKYGPILLNSGNRILFKFLKLEADKFSNVLLKLEDETCTMETRKRRGNEIRQELSDVKAAIIQCEVAYEMQCSN